LKYAHNLPSQHIGARGGRVREKKGEEREKNGRVKKLWARKKCSSILVMESARNRCKILNLYKTNFKRKIMDRSKLLRLCIVYPFLMRAMYLGRQWFSPYYMDSTCLLDLVRTSSPAHFNGHPFWPYYLNDTSVTCQSTTGIPLDTYFLQMYKDGVIENKILNGILTLTSLWGAYEIAHKIMLAQTMQLWLLLYHLALYSISLSTTL
jgi:hypothetical protein